MSVIEMALDSCPVSLLCSMKTKVQKGEMPAVLDPPRKTMRYIDYRTQLWTYRTNISRSSTWNVLFLSYSHEASSKQTCGLVFLIPNHWIIAFQAGLHKCFDYIGISRPVTYKWSSFYFSCMPIYWFTNYVIKLLHSKYYVYYWSDMQNIEIFEKKYILLYKYKFSL